MATVNTVLDVQKISKRFGARVLFEQLSFSLAEGQKTGLIARNGIGKSTLLAILTGKESADEGAIVYRKDTMVGFLEQEPVFAPEQTVEEVCLEHFSSEEARMKARQYLTQLKITRPEQPMGQLSGGQRKRVALAIVLAGEPDLLFLDEPTNHLDLEMIEWLEGYLSRARVTLLMVTHDRYFLDKVCNNILEIDGRELFAYQGNYAYYLEKRQERIDARRAEIEKAANLYRTELEWMRRMPQARGHKAKYREEAFYELQAKAHQRIEERQLRLKARNVYIGSKIFECSHVSKTFDDEKVILNDFNYNFARFEKMGIIGSNGTGKSTFIKLLLGLEPLDSGHFDIGETVRFGYYSQEGMVRQAQQPWFDEQLRVIDTITRKAERIDMGGGKMLTASQLLQQFLFTPEEQYDYVYKLSGGQRRKLYLCTILMENPNFLILDEPTNDLDIPTIQALENYLQDFAGCVIVVSHDRYFMDKVVDHTLVFHGNGRVEDFPGNYTQYREYLTLATQEERMAQRGKEASLADDATKAKKSYRNDTRRRLSFNEKREKERLEKEIAALEAEQKQLEADLCSGTLSVDAITEKSRRLPKLTEELDEKSMRWLELSEIES